MSALEYRVVWTRAGRRESRRIYQTHTSAVRKAQAVLAMERIKGDIPSLADMPDLVEPPVVQARPVGEWEPDEHTVIDHASVLALAEQFSGEYSPPTGDGEWPF